MEYLSVFLMGVLLTLATIAVVKRYSRKDDAKIPTNIRSPLLKESYQGIPLDPQGDILKVFDGYGAQVGKFNLDPRQNLEDLHNMADVPNWPDFGVWRLEHNNREPLTGTFHKEVDALVFRR